jgi:hypothetical protein
MFSPKKPRKRCFCIFLLARKAAIAKPRTENVSEPKADVWVCHSDSRFVRIAFTPACFFSLHISPRATGLLPHKYVWSPGTLVPPADFLYRLMPLSSHPVSRTMPPIGRDYLRSICATGPSARWYPDTMVDPMDPLLELNSDNAFLVDHHCSDQGSNRDGSTMGSRTGSSESY